MANIEVYGFDSRESSLLDRIRTAMQLLGYDDSSAVITEMMNPEVYDSVEENVCLVGCDIDQEYSWPQKDFPEEFTISIIDSYATTAGPKAEHAPYLAIFAKTEERLNEIVDRMRANKVGMDTEKHLIPDDSMDLIYPCVRVLYDEGTDLPSIMVALRPIVDLVYTKKISFVSGKDMV